MASKPGGAQTNPPPKKPPPKGQAGAKPGPAKKAVNPAPAPPPNPPIPPEVIVPEPVPPPPEPEPPKKKQSMSIYGNLLPDYGSDHWDEGLIPQRLIDEIYAELLSEASSGSEESFEHVTESGTVVRLRRKKRRQEEEEEEEEEEETSAEEDQTGRPRRISIPDVEGGIPKSKLKTMSIQRLNDALVKIYDDIKFLRTENLVLDRTISKMEQREREIEASLPAFTYKFPWELEKKYQAAQKLMNLDEVCKDDLSSDEEDPNWNGIYVPIVPANEVDFNDPYFDALSENTKAAMTQYMHAIGEVAPPNFDVFRHNYGELVKPGTADLVPREEQPLQANFHKEIGNKEKEGPGGEADKQQQGGVGEWSGEGTPSGSQALLIDQDFAGERLEQEEDEDPEFPGFVSKLAKKLPITEKLKYAHIEEECMRDEFFTTETDGIKQENAVQVYIDTFIESFNVTSKLMEMFKTVLQNAVHPLTGRLRAERIMRFRERVQKRILGEETKVALRLMEAIKQKKKVDMQLRSNRDLGESIQLIDYEQLKIENAEFVESIEDQHGILKSLKIITASTFQQLKEHREKLGRRVAKAKQVSEDIVVRGNLKRGFDTNYEKYTDNAAQIRGHNDFLKKRLRAFMAPSTMDYIGQKANQHNLEEEVSGLKKKVGALNLSLVIARGNYRKFRTLMPKNEEVRQENQAWLDEVRREVEEQGLLGLVDKDEGGAGGSLETFFLSRPKRPSGPVKGSVIAVELAAAEQAHPTGSPVKLDVLQVHREAELAAAQEDRLKKAGVKPSALKALASKASAQPEPAPSTTVEAAPSQGPDYNRRFSIRPGQLNHNDLGSVRELRHPAGEPTESKDLQKRKSTD